MLILCYNRSRIQALCLNHKSHKAICSYRENEELKDSMGLPNFFTISKYSSEDYA